ncbi:MAG TPA: glycosyltransferase family 9 protein [Chroococcales cyanobacterium]
MKILIVKLSAIGDVIHSLPVADYLKAAIPGLEITWVVEKTSADMVLNNPAVDEVIVFPAKQWLKDTLSGGKSWLATISDARSFFADLRDRRFDAAIDLQGLMKSSLLCLASGARIRVGFAGTREFAETLLTHKLNVGDYFGHDVPVVELNLKLAEYSLKALGISNALVLDRAPRFPLPQATAESAVKLDAALLVPGATGGDASGNAGGASLADRLPPGTVPSGGPAPQIALSGAVSSAGSILNIVMIPGTTWVSKIWPAEKWVELGIALSDKYECRIILIGARSEESTNGQIAERLRVSKPELPVLDLTSKTTLLELIALFERSDVVIGGDTGPLHLAAATGKPRVVGIFGATPWRRNGPYGPQCRTLSLSLDCQPCYSKKCRIRTVACLTELPAEWVLTTVDELLPS